MRIERLRVAELRQFREPFELAGLQPGLNLFSGPNEAGKSTLVRAIRAAFFERHRSTSVDDLRPYGDAAAAPRVELDFEHAGTAYRLSKSFLHKKRCELLVDTRRLEGVEAEDALAELLGYEYAAKGASREDRWGIPGLLWIEQGAGQALRDAVGHASAHLRRALDATLGELSASGGDEVVAQLQQWRDELLTRETGRPRGPLQKAQEDATALATRLATLQREVASYRDQVDQLRTLREAHAADARDEPWRVWRRQLAQAEQALQAAQSLAGERERAQERVRQAEGLRSLLVQRLAAADRQHEGLAARDAALAAARAGHEDAAAAEARAQQAQAAATALAEAARGVLALAREADTRLQLQRQAADAGTRVAELGGVLQRAEAEAERAAVLQREAARLHVPAADLKALRRLQAARDEARIRQAAVATRLRFELLPGATLQLDGEPLSGAAERLLAAPAQIDLPGLGRLHVVPGGSDLAELAAQQAALADEQGALLQRLGLADLAEAEARVQAHARHAADADAAAQAARVLAPQGVAALRGDRDAAQARWSEAEAALARLPAAAAEPAQPLDLAERAHEAARSAAESATRLLQQAREALAASASGRDAAQRERDALKAALDDPQLQADLAARRLQLAEAGAQHAAAQAALAAIDERIAAARPDVLQQDVQRLARSAEEAERGHQARDRQIVQLESVLAAAGAAGLEDELARVAAEHDQARRRAAELQRRAEALSYLLERLQARRHALTQRLQAPLQLRLQHYLTLLFPGGRLQVDDGLVPQALVRPGGRGDEAADFDTLSFGAREQMGLIARLAYADLLQQAGRPTLVILDDALVHSDEQRLAQMKRVLFDAGQRHQVLLFTCHPARWRDLGVAVRALR